MRHAWPGEILGGREEDEAASTRTLGILKGLINAKGGVVHDAVLAHAGLSTRVDMLRVRSGRLELFAIRAKSFVVPVDQIDPTALLKCADLDPEYRDLVDAVGFQVIVAERALAASGIDVRLHPIVPCLVLANKSVACGDLEQYGRFVVGDTSDRIGDVRWVGNPNDGYRSPLIVTVDVSQQVHNRRQAGPGPDADSTLDEVVRHAVNSWAAPTRLDPLDERGTKCKACEFNCKRTSADGSTQDGFSVCWGDRADEARGLMDLYMAGNYRGLPGERRWIHEFLKSSVTPPLSIESLPEFDGAPPGQGTTIRTRQIEVAHLTASAREFANELANDPKMDWDFGRNLKSVAAEDMPNKFKEKFLPNPNHPTGGDGVIWFLDFETSKSCVPHFGGLRPNEDFAFQFSLHGVPIVEDEVQWSNVIHGEWLFDYNKKDLTINELDSQFLEALARAFGDSGTEGLDGNGPVVHWSPHEATILQVIRRRLLTRADSEQGKQRIAFIDSLVARLVDMCEFAKDNVFHYNQGGGYSVKKMIAAVCSPKIYQARVCTLMGSMSSAGAQKGKPWDPYQALSAGQSLTGSLECDEPNGDAIDGGGSAMSAFNRLRYGECSASDSQVSALDSAFKLALAEKLKRYCKLDTVSMVVIWEWMRNISGWGPRLLDMSQFSEEA